MRMLDYWARTKLLPPSGQVANGKGSRRAYTFKDVVAILTICKLRERNCPLQQIRNAIRYLKTHYPDSATTDTLARLTLITDGKEVYLLTDERQVMNVVTRQWVWSVPLGLLINEANEKVDALPQEWTEPLTVNRQTFRLVISRDPDCRDFLVECRELPGFLQRVATADNAVDTARDAIVSLLSLRERRHRRLPKSANSGVA